MSRPKTNWNNPGSPVAGTHFKVREVLAKSGYSKMPRGPMMVGPLPAITPRRNATKQALAMETLRTRVNKERAKHKIAKTGITVNSWARSWAHNKAVGGATLSRHLYFLACDITREEVKRLMPWPGGSAEFDRICDELFRKGGFGQYPAGARHVDTRGWRARWTSF